MELIDYLFQQLLRAATRGLHPRLSISWSHLTTNCMHLEEPNTLLSLHKRKGIRSSNHLAFIYQP